MKLHPLHNIQRICEHMQATGEYWPQERCTGRTESLALKAVAHAMQYPHQWHRLVDHHGTRPAHQNLRRACERIVHLMGYIGFTFRDVEICFGTPPRPLFTEVRQ